MLGLKFLQIILGWVSSFSIIFFCIGRIYIRISSGFDFEDASTIKGVKNNYNGDEFLDTKVEQKIVSKNFINLVEC